MPARPGDWVQIHRVVLAPHERTGKLPEDTRAVPFESWSKGFLVGRAADETVGGPVDVGVAGVSVGDLVEVETVVGRRLRGRLVALNPGYDHGFGTTYVPELLHVARQAQAVLAEAHRDRDRHDLAGGR
ncbi:2-amino-4-ketopentanoate thiolase alpha subunit [Austwickia sp. TVS 96-490-7B]|uniref:2-amino-4-ketopentanoate thiolase n=1 Tax=Austwickia sp. TVS 96-490-7B TaxID=2830843 RepID=UPI001C5998E6|nr:2-amino-4-ketopentanoate thiolase [Austwickia sp. TVS 96-490-7B]MBW3086986.1 2-amino-4-ketopentanoate thiolase alpha subunit [Austwickia sp. TVS 96-490-7B]